jgi:Tubulin binding cofactor C
MHDSTTVKLLLSVSSHPIMEDSQDIVIGPYHAQPALSNDNAPQVRADMLKEVCYVTRKAALTGTRPLFPARRTA